MNRESLKLLSWLWYMLLWGLISMLIHELTYLCKLLFNIVAVIIEVRISDFVRHPVLEQFV